MVADETNPVLVMGATGAQGGAVVRALLSRGRAVRALVRDPGSPGGMALDALGVSLVTGAFEDTPSLEAAMAGADAVFSVQTPPTPDDPDAERKQARAIIAAARRAAVRHMVHSSVSNTGDFRTMSGWAEGRWERNYWESKADIEDMVRAAAFPVHTILRPAFMMENFAMPKARFMFPDLAMRRIRTAVDPDTRIALVAAADIGAAATMAIDDPAGFDAVAVELAGDHLTMGQIAAIVGRVKGVHIVAETLSTEQLIASGQHAGWIETQRWLNVVGYPARPRHMEAFGLTPTRMAQWASENTAAIEIDRGPHL